MTDRKLGAVEEAMRRQLDTTIDEHSQRQRAKEAESARRLGLATGFAERAREALNVAVRLIEARRSELGLVGPIEVEVTVDPNHRSEWSWARISVSLAREGRGTEPLRLRWSLLASSADEDRSMSLSTSSGCWVDQYDERNAPPEYRLRQLRLASDGAMVAESFMAWFTHRGM